MSFSQEFGFAELHMPAVRRVLGELPAKIFFDINTAPIKRDMEEATDLVLSVSSGDIAVRIRRRKFYDRCIEKGYSLDWSIRVQSNGYRTEIDKLREGFARFYFFAYSEDNKGGIVKWWLIDMDNVRDVDILGENWPVFPNGDGTSGMYIPLSRVDVLGCVVVKG